VNYNTTELFFLLRPSGHLSHDGFLKVAETEFTSLYFPDLIFFDDLKKNWSVSEKKLVMKQITQAPDSLAQHSSLEINPDGYLANQAHWNVASQ